MKVMELVELVSKNKEIASLHINYSKGSKHHMPGWRVVVLLSEDRGKSLSFNLLDFIDWLKN